MRVRLFARAALTVLLLAPSAGLRAQAAPAAPSPTAAAAVPSVDQQMLVSECQKTLNVERYVGMIWWVPSQFWELTNAQNPQGGRMVAAALAPYTVVALAVGRQGENGILPEWVSEDDLRAHTTIEDGSGVAYPPLPPSGVSDEAQAIVGIMRPVFSKLLGNVGENLHFILFPLKGKDGQPLADPVKPGQFTVVLKDILGPGSHAYLYHLPLTALLPPKFCPVGGERVEADWIYCPWHGVKLDSGAQPAPAAPKPAATQPPQHSPL